MVIGSGPIIIGQAAEFDYAGTQACKSLREEGISTVLINSNPATIMTDKEIADALELPPIKLHCSVLAEETIQTAIKDWEKKTAHRKHNNPPKKEKLVVWSIE